MFRQPRKYHPLSLNTLLYGKTCLSDNDNCFLLQAVQQYIEDSSRLQYFDQNNPNIYDPKGTDKEKKYK